MNSYTKEEVAVLVRIIEEENHRPGTTDHLIKMIKKNDGLLPTDFEWSPEAKVFLFLVRFENVPKFINHKFHLLIKWRLQIGR